MNDSKPKQNKRALKAILLLTALIVVAALAVTTVAYLVKHDRIDNTLTPAKLDIELIETGTDTQHWKPENATSVSQPDAAKLVAPAGTIAKAPKIKNKDNTPAFVFLKVTVPYLDSNSDANIDASDGQPSTIGVNEKVPLYKFVVNNSHNTSYGETSQTIREAAGGTAGWFLIPTTTDFSNPAVNITDHTLTYVYAYVDSSLNLVALNKDGDTCPLFDSVYVTNYSSPKSQITNLEDKDYSIDVKAYGIQTEYLEDNTVSSDTWTPAYVWSKIESNGA